MNPRDPNIQLLEVVAQALDELCDELLFVGGCAAGLLCTSPSAAPARVTYDVDVVAEVVALSAYYALEEKFAARGFVRDMSPDAPICRWRFGAIEVDLMPSDERVLGFANRWYPLAHKRAVRMSLPSGRQIRLISGPAFLATKLEAFATRGQGDLMSSHDFEDIINVLDGRPEIVDEVSLAGDELLSFLASSFGNIVRHLILKIHCRVWSSLMTYMQKDWGGCVNGFLQLQGWANNEKRYYRAETKSFC